MGQSCWNRSSAQFGYWHILFVRNGFLLRSKTLKHFVGHCKIVCTSVHNFSWHSGRSNSLHASGHFSFDPFLPHWISQHSSGSSKIEKMTNLKNFAKWAKLFYKVNQKYSMKDTFYVSIACNDLTTFPRLRGTITIRSTFWSIRAFHPFPTPFKYCVTCWIVQATLEFPNFYTFNRWALFIPVWFSTGHRAVRYKCFIWTIGIPFTPCGLI